jgi:2-hydroxychromene-2-carboxylate isomerase
VPSSASTRPARPPEPTGSPRPSGRENAGIDFFFDLGSPYAYLAAERLERSHADVTWRPVLLGAIFAARGHGSWSQTAARDERVAEIEARAERYGLPPLAWPPGWPPNTLAAMRAATWTASPAFALACFRRAFAGGEDLGDLAVLEAAAAECGLEGLRDAVADPRVKQRLKDATDEAWATGVTGVPAFRVGAEVFYGDDRLDEALTRSQSSA